MSVGSGCWFRCDEAARLAASLEFPKCESCHLRRRPPGAFQRGKRSRTFGQKAGRAGVWSNVPATRSIHAQKHQSWHWRAVCHRERMLLSRVPFHAFKEFQGGKIAQGEDSNQIARNDCDEIGTRRKRHFLWDQAGGARRIILLQVPKIKSIGRSRAQKEVGQSGRRSLRFARRFDPAGTASPLSQMLSGGRGSKVPLGLTRVIVTAPSQ